MEHNIINNMSAGGSVAYPSTVVEFHFRPTRSEQCSAFTLHHYTRAFMPGSSRMPGSKRMKTDSKQLLPRLFHCRFELRTACHLATVPSFSCRWHAKRCQPRNSSGEVNLPAGTTVRLTLPGFTCPFTSVARCVGEHIEWMRRGPHWDARGACAEREGFE